MTSPLTAERLAAALAGEHAALYAYALLGTRLPAAEAARARTAERLHRDRRDAALLRLAAAGGTPPPAEPAYALPFPVAAAPAARRLAVHVEDRAAGLWRAAIAVSTGADRALALAALRESAVWAARWRRLAGLAVLPSPFPGRPAEPARPTPPG